MRMLLYGLCAAPFVYACDLNGGIMKLGFSTGSVLESEFKIKPDYATATLFTAERKDVPTLKNF